jgi:hypothetical protein
MRKEVKLMIDFAEHAFSFPSDNQDRQEPWAFPFASTVKRASVALKGFNIHYNDGDHHILREGIAAHCSIRPGAPDIVDVVLDFNLVDNGHPPYGGSAEVLVIVDRV